MIDSHGTSEALRNNPIETVEPKLKHGKILQVHGDITVTADLALLPIYSWFQKHEREHDPQCVVQIKAPLNTWVQVVVWQSATTNFWNPTIVTASKSNLLRKKTSWTGPKLPNAALKKKKSLNLQPRPSEKSRASSMPHFFRIITGTAKNQCLIELNTKSVTKHRCC